MSVPEEARLSQKLDECLEARARMIQHAEHLHDDLVGALEVIGRVRRLLSKLKQDRIFVADYAQPTRDKTARLNSLDQHIEELEQALSHWPLEESPRKEAVVI